MKYFFQHVVTILTSCLSLSLSFSISPKHCYLHIDNKKDELSVLEGLFCARIGEIAGSCRCLYFRYDENPAKRNSVERNRTSRPLSWMETLEGLPRRRRWSTDSDNHLFASVSYHQHPTGPTHFPFLESRRCTFPRRALGAGSQMPIRHLSSN